MIFNASLLPSLCTPLKTSDATMYHGRHHQQQHPHQPLLLLQASMLTVLLHVMTLTLTSGHPQCTDSTPPFTSPSTSPSSLCSHYHSSGCCSPQQEETLHDVYLTVKHRLSVDDWRRCKSHVQKLLCAKCSPFSAHLFEAETLTNTRTRPSLLPKMCPEFCHEFYTKCRFAAWFLDPELSASLVFQSERQFCEKMNMTEIIYCQSGQQEHDDEDEADEEHNSDTSEVENIEDSASQKGCICLERILDGLANPVIAKHAGDNTGHIFVGEQRGLVYEVDPVLKKYTDSQATPFLNISHSLRLTSHYDERGLGGLAFHPGFPSNGRVFVYYNAPLTARDTLSEEERRLKGKWDHVSRLSELRVRSGGSAGVKVVDPDSERVLLEVRQPFANHNGGELFFLDDGYLYLFLGDGGYSGFAGDPFNLAQNKSWLLGKVLRLDVDTPSSDPHRPYSIPPDNPFAGGDSASSSTSARPEIFAYGVRNIWRCGVDMGDPNTGEGRGRVLCGDVGQARFEEIDLLKKGANYGWSAREGFNCYNKALCGKIGEEELPVHTYSHSVGQSVTGGQFYRGICSPALNGLYIYGDYQSRRLFSLQQIGESWHNSDISLCSADLCSARGLTNKLDHYILSFGQDQQGEVYMLTSKSSKSFNNDGAVYRIVDPHSEPAGKECTFGQTSATTQTAP